MSNFDKVESVMRERGLSREDIWDWLEEEYAPLSDDLKLGALTPTMCDNLIKDIRNGKLEG